ncbi:hypothetical protein FDP41_001484 [Naegleria fowleri]|uniref:Uncharacterized protein n=1 Tax=Naegleria fowleri TaxID=5763 RepID=A0A6A5BW30_NAEFO|nr:uncharacterized protein FDP41_001484 [Naegleria fowleri]KAF0979506.1 hypothetical protein FDP41_001484 [Naegleria fowleri]
MSIPRLKVAFSTELDYCMEKAHRFWNMTIGETDELKYNDNYNRYTLNRTTEELKKTSKKNIAHGLRKLRFAYQYLENGKIIHLQEWNALAQEVFDKTKYYYEWMQFEDTYKPIYEEKSCNFKPYCSKDNQEGRKRVHEFMNSTQALTQEDQETVQHSVLYLFKDVHSLTKLFNIDVSHFDPSCETTTPQQVAQCTTFQLSLNLNMFYLNYDRKISNEVLQCDGAIIELMSSPQQFRLVCAPRWFIPDIRDQPEIAISCQSLSCFKLPYGDKVSLFFHKNAWTIACSEIERANWKRWVLLDNVPSNSVNSWRDDFWNIWKNLKMELPPENMQDKTFHFVWNKHQGISLVSVRVNQTCQIISHSEMVSLCEKLNWNVLEPMKELEFSTLSSGKLFWKQALEKVPH